jgi:exonuclease III
MKIVSWNCGQGFTGDKAVQILKCHPDILVIQECREDDYNTIVHNTSFGFKKENSDWYGDHIEAKADPKKDLGVAVFYTKPITRKFIEKNEYRYVLPYSIPSEKQPFILFAVWTKKYKNENNKTYEDYHEPVFNALEVESYKELLKEKTPAIFIGDFNTGSVLGSGNEKWYKGLKEKFCKEKFYNCATDQEWAPTFYRGNGSWLDDHCFATEGLYKNVISFSIGNPKYWSGYSDHCPIIVDFDFQ